MVQFDQVFSALITPFKQTKIDYESLAKLLAHQIKNGVRGFVINGTTGESPTLDWSEVCELTKFIKNKTQELTPEICTYILGTGSNSTKKTIEMSEQAKELGVDAVLVVVPYYNKPPQRGLYEHFKAVANASQVPVILYNVPGRTITSLTADTVAELSKEKNIIGIKEATGDMALFQEMKSKARDGFLFLSGDDGTYVNFLKLGGDGVISVASQILPYQFVNWTKAAKTKNFSQAEEQILKLKNIIDLLFCEANPIPLKMALHKMNILQSPELRLPLVELEQSKTKILIEELKAQNIL